MRPSRVRTIVRWCIIAASIIAFDVAATLWVVASRSVGFNGVGGGSFTASYEYCRMLDDSYVLVIHNFATGKTIGRTVIRPATRVGLCRVCLPAFAAALLTLLVLALALTRRGRRYVAEFPVPRITTRRFMIAAAVTGADVGWVLRTMESSSLQSFLFGQWTLMEVDLLILHVLAFMAAGAALLFSFVRRRCSPNNPEAVTFRL